MNFMSLLSQLCMSQWKKLASLQTRRPRCSQHFKHGASAPSTEQNNLSVPSASKKNPLLLFFQVFYFPLSSYQVFFFFSNFLSTKQANTAQRHHSAADNKSVSRFTKKKGANHLHWFGSYTMIPNVNPTAFMLNFLLCVLQLTLCSKTMLKSSFQRLGVFMFPIQWLMQWAISEMNLTLSTSNVWIGEQKQSACSKVTTMTKILSKTIILSVSYLWTSYSQN